MAQHDDPPAAPPPAEPPDNPAPLFAASRADDVRRLERALSEGASVDGAGAVEAEDGFPPAYSRRGVTALKLAVGLGRNRIAKLLLERGADVRDLRGPTAVFVGADFGNVEMVVALAAAGGDVNAVTTGGLTPIWIGERRGVNGCASAPSFTTSHVAASPCQPYHTGHRPQQVREGATRRR